MSKWESSGKYKNINKILDIIGIILILALVIITFMYWLNAPDIVPTHYNVRGEIDGYGSKNTIFFLLSIVIILYIGLYFLAKYPQIYNYAVKITPVNKEKQYNMATTFMRVLNVELVLIFFYIQLKQVTSISGNNKNLSMAFLPIELMVLFGSIAFYIYKSIKNK
ncbi:hypothetical protein UT300007_11330 [Clostridium sp. CTA-7]